MRKRLLAPVLALLLSTTLGSAASLSDPPECVVAAAWVRAHHDALPTTLPELSKHSMAYRRAIYDVLPAATRAELWREHLQGFLRPDAPLDARQRAMVREVIAELPALTAPGADRKWTHSVGTRVATVFDRTLGARVFATLGEAPKATGTARRPLCNCSFAGDFSECPEGTTCTTSLCSFTSTGCGVTWSEPCSGVCR